MSQRALQMPEIVGLICNEIEEQHPIGEVPFLSSVLASTARVSSIFANECLGRLWSCQDGLCNLLRLLPTECYTMKGSDVETMTVERTLTRKDFDRVTLYAQRIKHMQCKKLPPINVCSSAITSLEYSVSSADHTGLPYISMLLACSLETLHLTASGDSTSFLATSGARCANLTEFSMFTPEPYASESLSTAYNSFLGHLTRLDTIDVDSMACASFQQLAALPTLQSLVIRDNSLHRFKLPSGMCFPTLDNLELHYSSFKTMGKMLDAMETPQLTSIEVDSAAYAKAHIIRAIFIRFAEQLPLSQLHAITIDTDAETVPSGTHEALTLHTLEPLLSFGCLVHANIRLNTGFDLSDTCIARIAAAWPQIKSLRLALPYDAKYTVWSSTTIAGLQTFACNCPLLESLGLSLDGSVEPPEVQLIDVMTQQVKLRTLDVGTSMLEFPQSTAEFLSAVFPALAKIETYWDSSNHIQDRFNSVSAWRLVESQLRFGIKVRKWERVLGQVHGSSLPTIVDVEGSEPIM
ncbi:hypothetical protein B0H16DRAFT_1580902 [Mycena metata]|uniref:Uncharacterized protein n=1 Tax=Mycena metata TaxID=1033252 RepID=A0AAD7I0L5_9AGAR|nr:hypothetical protein B0H16DRAFT_1580902 [Mycena metata]